MLHYKKSEYDKQTKKILKKYSDKAVPVNIIDMANRLGIGVFYVDTAPYEYEMQYNPNYSDNIDKFGSSVATSVDDYRWNIFIKENNALNNRVFIAYCIAVFVGENGDIPKCGIKRDHPVPDGEYKWIALSILCPYKETVKQLKKYNSVWKCARKFLISDEDFYDRELLIKP